MRNQYQGEGTKICNAIMMTNQAPLMLVQESKSTMSRQKAALLFCPTLKPHAGIVLKEPEARS